MSDSVQNPIRFMSFSTTLRMATMEDDRRREINTQMCEAVRVLCERDEKKRARAGVCVRDCIRWQGVCKHSSDPPL